MVLRVRCTSVRVPKFGFVGAHRHRGLPGPLRRRRSLLAPLLLMILLGSLLPGRLGAQSQPGPISGVGEPGLPSKTARGRVATPAAVPDIFGPGAVLNAGSVQMKITNNGLNGNLPGNAISSDPSAQWPGSSGVEYLFVQVLGVGAVNPTATDPNAVRRVSTGREWFPPTPDPEDRMYRAYDGVVNGSRLVNDDTDFNVFTGDPSIDEDFLDGRDNDGDGRIDEDYAALGQLMFSCVMRDDTPAALAQVANQVHVPLVVECRQLAWCYSVPGFQNFNVIEYTIYNRSGHTLDSMYFGMPIDMDAGPLNDTNYFNDDMDVPYFPQGQFTIDVGPDDPRYQADPTTDEPLCPSRNIRVNGFSVVDNDGDEGRTPGVVSFLLFGHTVDPLGIVAPRQVGFRAFRSYLSGTPFSSNGAPGTDQQRFELVSGTQNIGLDGFITAEPGDQQGDYVQWNGIGPFLQVPDGGSISLTVGVAIDQGAFSELQDYPVDYQRYKDGQIPLQDLFDKYPALLNAFSAQVAYEGVYEQPRTGFEDQVPNCPGCETGLKLPKGETPRLIAENCPEREGIQKLVTDNSYTWFDFDCDHCTGVFDRENQQGYFLRHWNAEAPPAAPNVNVASTYNYTDNPSRVAAAGDRAVVVAWDNLAENTPDPKSGEFDFRSYRIWKVAGWRRPPGASGPNDEDWALLGELRLFDHKDPLTGIPIDSNFTHDPVTDTLVCPKIFVPNYEFPPNHPHCDPANAGRYPGRVLLAYGGCRDSATVNLCLRRGDLWDRQSGLVVRPDTTIGCVRVNPADPTSMCVRDSGLTLPPQRKTIYRTRYPVGLYRYVDREVKNGFVYFYSVTAGDSSQGGELHGRRAAVEADGVVPQASVSSGQGVWVVPNPYRGYSNISDRSSSWDLTPNATDPTGTHIDFMGMPSGPWTLRIFTVSGDLVQELHDSDPVNDSIRGQVLDSQGNVRHGVNRQQDTANDGQARWNLISRNGQDVASGIYVFVVDSGQGQQRGRFVVIR